MRLLSVCGDTLFKSSYITIKESVEEAISEGVCLNGINLRKANLANAHMDMAKMKNACLWGANLTNADMSDGDYSGSDFRTSILKDACLSNSKCSEANFHGAYFSKTLIDGTDLTRAQFSCPSIFSCDLSAARSLKSAIYYHHGELACSLSRAPVVIQGLEKPVIVMDDVILIGSDTIKKQPVLDMQKGLIGHICKRIIQS